MSILTAERGIFKEPNSIVGKIILIMVIILFTTRILTRTPLIFIYLPFEALWLLGIVSFTILYGLYVVMINKHIDELHYYYVLIFLMPIQAGVCAHLSENMPILSGYFAQRHWFGIGGVFLILFFLRIHFITLKDLYRAFEWLGWASLIYFVGCYMFLDPAKYIDQSFVGFSDIKGGYRFKFGIDFIAFFSVYYTVRYVSTKDRKMLFYSGIFLSYLFFLHQGRSVMIAVVASIAVFYMFEVNFQRAFRVFLYVGIVFMFIMGVMYAIIPDRVNDYIYQYTSLASIVFTGNVVGEESLDARIEEIGILLVYLQTYPIGWIIGLGKFSSGESFIGTHNITTVPPGDIGILGSIMTYGIIGSIIIYWQFWIAVRSSKFIVRHKKDSFLVASKYVLIFCFLSSLAKGYLFMQPGSTAIFIMVICAYKMYELQLDKQGVPLTLATNNKF
ncbi:MAG: hypothetical protein H7Y00_12080 [Fimbriimonadaceae bacterium]|nr:hypothetical protein [Chitinophagales bacterium]